MCLHCLDTYVEDRGDDEACQRTMDTIRGTDQRPPQKQVVCSGSRDTFGGSPECFAAGQRVFVQILSERSKHVRIRTITAAFVLAAPLLALGSPQAAACWETG